MIVVHPVCPLVVEGKRLVEASWWKGLALGKTGQGHAFLFFFPLKKACLKHEDKWLNQRKYLQVTYPTKDLYDKHINTEIAQQ